MIVNSLLLLICRGLHWIAMQCIHPSQRCIPSRQMTDNIFAIEGAALAHVACAPQESGVLLTDFATAYPRDNHSCIFSVLEFSGLPDFPYQSLQSIYMDSITHGMCGSKTRTMVTRSTARLSCEWLSFFAMAFDPIF